jgi:hypothetical protein
MTVRLVWSPVMLSSGLALLQRIALSGDSAEAMQPSEVRGADVPVAGTGEPLEIRDRQLWWSGPYR